MSETVKNDEKLKNSFLNCVQRLQFSKDDKTPAEIAEIERTILMTKCFSAVK